MARNKIKITSLAVVALVVVALVVGGVVLWARRAGTSCPDPEPCPDHDPSLCPDPEPCPDCRVGYTLLDGYEFTQGDTGTGDVLLAPQNQSPVSLKEICDTTPGCQGFSTDGALYATAGHERSMNPALTTFSDTGFYGAL